MQLVRVAHLQTESSMNKRFSRLRLLAMWQFVLLYGFTIKHETIADFV